jgi:glycopeptide antibiotics resistance protein
METIVHVIYRQALYKIVSIMLIFLLVWGFLETITNRKLWRKLNMVLLVFYTVIIFNITIVSRHPVTYDIVLIPFHSFVEAMVQPEMYRTMLMNVFLFFPYGLTIPFALPENFPHKIASTICTGAIFSIVIETIQYIFHLGRCETDDVIMNTLGVAIGTLSYVLSGFWEKCSAEKNNHERRSMK